MPRNRVIYNAEALYVGPTPCTGQHWSMGNTGINLISGLTRIQSADYSFNIARQDVNQFGELAAIDRVILQQPTVNLGFSYLQANLTNERLMGFNISSGTQVVSAISGILNKVSDEKNYFIKTVAEGNDAKGDTALNATTIGIGNGFITSYTAEGSVGNFPRVSLGIEALNLEFENATGTNIPAINPTNGNAITTWQYTVPVYTGNAPVNPNISVLRPGDITLSIGYNEGGALISDAKIQSYSLGFNLSRNPLLKLGSKYAFSREINFPVPVTMSVNAMMGDLQTGSLVEIINNNTDYDLSVTINQPGTSTPAVYYSLKEANLDSQSFTSSIGGNKGVTLSFTAQVGGPAATGMGLYLSGLN